MSEPLSLVEQLATVPDPRSRKGRRHPLTAILALILGQVEDLRPLHVIGTIALWCALATATISGVQYYRHFVRSGL